MNDTLINVYQNELTFMKQERNKWKERTKKAVKERNNLQSKIDKAIEYIEKDTRWFDSEYASIYGELCDCKGYNANRLEVMVNPSNLLKILKEDK